MAQAALRALTTLASACDDDDVVPHLKPAVAPCLNLYMAARGGPHSVPALDASSAVSALFGRCGGILCRGKTRELLPVVIERCRGGGAAALAALDLLATLVSVDPACRRLVRESGIYAAMVADVQAGYRAKGPRVCGELAIFRNVTLFGTPTFEPREVEAS